MDSLSISQLAQMSGVNIQTIRYYERQGLLAPAARTESGYRIFAADTARRIHFIKRAQKLGFTLNEIRELLSLRMDGGSTCSDVRTRAQTKLADIDLKVRHLEAMRTSLARLIKSCRGTGPTEDCPILECLDREGC